MNVEIDVLGLIDMRKVVLVIAVLGVCLVATIFAVVSDFVSGIKAAKKRGIPVSSKGFRRSISKLGIYVSVELSMFLVDAIFLFFSWYSVPVVIMLVSAACILIEGRSIYENLKVLRENLDEIPAAIKELANVVSSQDYSKILDIVTTSKKKGEER